MLSFNIRREECLSKYRAVTNDIPIQKNNFLQKSKAKKVQVPERLKELISKYGQEIF